MCVEGACEKKPKTFVNNRLLLQHKKDHENLPCQECNKTFPSRRNLNRHRKRVQLSIGRSSKTVTKTQLTTYQPNKLIFKN